jgi:hypothetical protein
LREKSNYPAFAVHLPDQGLPLTVSAGLISFVTLLSLAACQSPVVPVRSYTLNATFTADGRQYAFSTSYQCHFEDIAWVSERGPAWHIRKGTAAIRLIGRLEDGTDIEVLPSSDSPDVLCPEHSGEIASQLFIATPDGNVAGIKVGQDENAPHHAHLLRTTLSLAGTGSAAFSPREQWPAPTKPRRRFYTIQATYYDSTLWKPQDIASMVNDKTIRWIDDANVWPFTQWAHSDVAVARSRQGIKQLSGYEDAGRRFSVAAAGEDWRFTGPNNDVTVWRPARMQPDSRQWIGYAGHRIELPLHLYYRLFYEQKFDRLIEFRAVYVDLW